MARRRSMYGRKRKINYGRVLLLLIILVAVIGLGFLIFRKDDYLRVVDEVINSDIAAISGTISSVNDVDTTVYSNNGIRYTNQHENIKKINSFTGTSSEDLDKAEKLKALFENLVKGKETVLVDDLPYKDSGYYWVDASFLVKDRKLFFRNETEYNFDLYYDIESKIVYVKEEYFSEFSKKNNKIKLQGYEVSEEFINLIEELTK